MTSLDTLSDFIEQRIADAEADLGPEAIGWIGMDAMNRARGRVSALRELEEIIEKLRVVESHLRGIEAAVQAKLNRDNGWAAWDALSPLEQWNADGNR